MRTKNTQLIILDDTEYHRIVYDIVHGLQYSTGRASIHGTWYSVKKMADENHWSVIGTVHKGYSEYLRARHAKIPPELRAAVLDRAGHKCQFCGSTSHLQIDHILPITDERSTTLENLQVLCKECNTSKYINAKPKSIHERQHGTWRPRRSLEDKDL